MQLNIIAAACRAVVNVSEAEITAALTQLATGNRSDAYALAQRFPRIKKQEELSSTEKLANLSANFSIR